jgi:hydrogenase maturation protease
MTAGLAEIYRPRPLATACPPILVLGVGNLLLQDDAAGLRMLQELSARKLGDDVELVDGGTLGLSLLGQVVGREVLVILDAVKLGSEPGTIHVLHGADLDRLRAQRSSTSHESNAVELLAYAQLLGYEPREVVVVGIEPESIRTGIGLNRSVVLALPAALAAARGAIAWARNRCVCA